MTPIAPIAAAATVAVMATAKPQVPATADAVAEDNGMRFVPRPGDEEEEAKGREVYGDCYDCIYHCLHSVCSKTMHGLILPIHNCPGKVKRKNWLN